MIRALLINRVVDTLTSPVMLDDFILRPQAVIINDICGPMGDISERTRWPEITINLTSGAITSQLCLAYCWDFIDTLRDTT